MGSGGGGEGYEGGTGGNGGAALQINANNITVSGKIIMNGSAMPGDADSQSGGGSGGSIKIIASNTLNISNSKIFSDGGNMHCTHNPFCGGYGAGGRILLAYYNNIYSTNSIVQTINTYSGDPILNGSVLIGKPTIYLLSPTNNSIVTIPVTILWNESIYIFPHIYQISTDNQFLNVVSSGTITTTSTQNISVSTSLSSGTYYWHVKNSTGNYSDWRNFTISGALLIPGRYNITVWDEQDVSKQILNYTIRISNNTFVLTKNSNQATGWTNFSAAEIAGGEYLILATPTGTFSNYYPRMVLSTSPANVTMYVPNGTLPNVIDLVVFSILDTTGRFPLTTSTITVSIGGYVLDKSYFSLDGTHPVFLIQGANYQITIQNGNNIYSSNYIPYGSGTFQIPISNFLVNLTSLDPFRYNITTNSSQILLSWADVGGVMNTLTFNVDKGVNRSDLCLLTTSVKYGQSPCSITNLSDIYYVDFSALMNDGSYRNQSFSVDYRRGTRVDSTGVSPIDGSPIGIGYKWNYGTFVMPDWVYNWFSVIFFIMLAGTFGQRFAGIGSIILA